MRVLRWQFLSRGLPQTRPIADRSVYSKPVANFTRVLKQIARLDEQIKDPRFRKGRSPPEAIYLVHGLQDLVDAGLE